MTDVVQLEYRPNGRGHIAIITLNNAKKLNSMNQDQFAVLSKRMREVALRDDVYVTVLTGKGRYFSAYVACEKSLNYPGNIANLYQEARM